MIKISTYANLPRSTRMDPLRRVKRGSSTITVGDGRELRTVMIDEGIIYPGDIECCAGSLSEEEHPNLYDVRNTATTRP